MISKKDKHYQNNDRDISKTAVGKIELGDLYLNEKGNETVYAVKIGNGSANLSYVVGQSEAFLESYRNNLVDGILEDFPVKNIGIWIILDRKTHLNFRVKKNLSDLDTPDINQLDMFILKNRLDEWKKEVRLLGLNPVIRINYVIE